MFKRENISWLTLVLRERLFCMVWGWIWALLISASRRKEPTSFIKLIVSSSVNIVRTSDNDNNIFRTRALLILIYASLYLFQFGIRLNRTRYDKFITQNASNLSHMAITINVNYGVFTIEVGKLIGFWSVQFRLHSNLDVFE